ncbi:hypothetical protein C2E23DRAFT_432108 [Lenzites betulinus]|nr:hypothetical protein C2E23DRAFT_432108 [Lenzites betulinus]
MYLLYSPAVGRRDRRIANRQESSAMPSSSLSRTVSGSSASPSSVGSPKTTSANAMSSAIAPASSFTTSDHDPTPVPPQDITTAAVSSSTRLSQGAGGQITSPASPSVETTTTVLPAPVTTSSGPATVTKPDVTTLHPNPPSSGEGSVSSSINDIPPPPMVTINTNGDAPRNITNPDVTPPSGPTHTAATPSGSNTWPGDSGTWQTWPESMSTTPLSPSPSSASQATGSLRDILQPTTTSSPATSSTASTHTDSSSEIQVSTNDGLGPATSSYDLSSFPLATSASQTSATSRSLSPKDIAAICVSVISFAGLCLILFYTCRRWRKKHARSAAPGGFTVFKCFHQDDANHVYALGPHDSFYGESIIGLRVSTDGMSVSSADQRQPVAASLSVRASSGTYNFPLPPSHDRRHGSEMTQSANSLTVLIPARDAMQSSNRSSAVSQDSIPIPYSAYEDAAVEPADWVDAWNQPRASSELMQHSDLSLTQVPMDHGLPDDAAYGGPVVI